MKKLHGLKFIKNYAYNNMHPYVKRPTCAYLTISSLCNSQYNNCKTCNLGCVAESTLSTSDINFIINEDESSKKRLRSLRREKEKYEETLKEDKTYDGIY